MVLPFGSPRRALPTRQRSTVMLLSSRPSWYMNSTISNMGQQNGPPITPRCRRSGAWAHRTALVRPYGRNNKQGGIRMRFDEDFVKDVMKALNWLIDLNRGEMIQTPTWRRDMLMFVSSNRIDRYYIHTLAVVVNFVAR